MAVEVWLRPNVRALLFGMLLPAAFGLLGLLLAVGLPGREPGTWMRAMGGIMLLLSGATIVALALQLRHPRLAYRDRHLLVRLRSGRPTEVPIEFVECFWLGQAPSLLPGRPNRNTETAAVVVRIADAAEKWRHQEANPRLGKWCEGYITIRGTWCEPLNIGLINRLNQRLAEVTRAASR